MGPGHYFPPLALKTVAPKLLGSKLCMCGASLLLITASPSWGQDVLPTSAEAPTGEVVSTDIWSIVFSGGWSGILIMLALIGLSLTAVYLICEHFLTIRRKEVIPEGLDQRVREYLQAGKLKEAEKACHEEPSFLSFVLLHGIAEAEDGWSAVEKGLEDASSEQAAKLLRKIEYLSVIGSLAPMVGLLGTVTGMLLTFHQVASTQGTAGASDLAEGIYQALVTTVVGLVIAIPALAAFAFFRNRVDQLVAEASYTALHTCRPLKRIRPQTGNSGGGTPLRPTPQATPQSPIPQSPISQGPVPPPRAER